VWRDITLDADNDLINALAAINAARSLDEIVTAQRGWRAPLVHIVAASSDGIALIAAGDPPVRDKAGVWTGRTTAAERLIVRDPPVGHLAAANNLARASDFTRAPNGAFDPFRVTRIHQFLEENASADLGGAMRMQMDKQSLLAQRLLPTLRQAQPTTARGKEALKLLASWNGAMDGDRPESLIFAAWIDALSRAIYADEIGDEAYARYAVPRPLFLDSILTRGGGDWCDNVDAPNRQTCAELITASLDKSANDLAKLHGGDMSKWRWRDAHAAKFAHPLFSGMPLLGGVFDVTAPIGGSADTLAVGAYFGDGDFTAVHGPGARAVYDFADLNRSRFIVAPGQSGHPLSPHYRDLVKGWTTGESFEVRADAPPKNATVLTLVPR
jgi:penicillin amidase